MKKFKAGNSISSWTKFLFWSAMFYMQNKGRGKAVKVVNFVAKWLNLYPTTVEDCRDLYISTLTWKPVIMNSGPSTFEITRKLIWIFCVDFCKRGCFGVILLMSWSSFSWPIVSILKVLLRAPNTERFLDLLKNWAFAHYKLNWKHFFWKIFFWKYSLFWLS